MLTRRSAVTTAAGLAAIAFGRDAVAQARDRTIKIGLNLSFTGADAPAALRIANAVQMAVDEANRKKTVKGHVFRIERFDDATPAAGQHDPTLGAANARRMIADATTLAAIGPMTSSVARSMLPILSEGNLPIISPSATSPDLTDPQRAEEFRPKGKVVFFRTIATDAFQGVNMANFYAAVLAVRSVFVLDDCGSFGVGLADSFEAQARKKGLQVLGRDRLDPKATDHGAILALIRSLGAQSLYYGGLALAGAALARQAHDIIPAVIKGSGDGIISTDFLATSGFAAAEGWYATQASADLGANPALAAWTRAYIARFKSPPDTFSITAHSAAEAIIEAARIAAATGKPVTRAALRDALQSVRVQTLQGMVEFDANGDIRSRTISVHQVRRDTTKPLDDPAAQFKYLFTASDA